MGVKISYCLLTAALAVISLLMYSNRQLEEDNKVLQQRLVTPSAGSWVPKIQLRDIDGERVSIGDDSDALRVIYVMDPECPVCEASLPGVRALKNGLGKAENELFVLSTRDGETLRSYRENHALGDVRFAQSDRSAHESMGILVVPTALVIDAAGRVQFAHVGVLDDVAVNRILVVTLAERRHAAAMMSSKEKS